MLHDSSKHKVKKILVFAQDPGGVNVVIPVFMLLRKRGFKVDIWGEKQTQSQFKKFAVTGRDIKKHLKIINDKSVLKLLKDKKYGLVITDTSGHSNVQRMIWTAAKNLNIPSFAIVDQWMNLDLRFSNVNYTSLVKMSEKKVNYDNLPSTIFVPDSFSKNKLIKLGVNKKLVVIGGHPYFEYLQQVVLPKLATKSLNKNKNVRILFASEPLSEVYGSSANATRILGYNEFSVCKSFVTGLRRLSAQKKVGVVFTIKLHPKELGSKYEKIKLWGDSKYLKIKINKNSNSWDLIKDSDAVCGMSSMVLLEAAILNKPVLSIQPKLKKEAFILSSQKIIGRTYNKAQLFLKLKSIMSGKLKRPTFSFIKNPTENIVKYVENLTWQN